MNENILKGLKACKEAISNEQAKIAKMKTILLDLKRKYQFKCKACKAANSLEDFKNLTTYHRDRDGDCYPSEFTDNCLVCPGCGAANRVYNHPQNEELLSVLDKNTHDVFKTKGDRYYDDHDPWV